MHLAGVASIYWFATAPGPVHPVLVRSSRAESMLYCEAIHAFIAAVAAGTHDRAQPGAGRRDLDGNRWAAGSAEPNRGDKRRAGDAFDSIHGWNFQHWPVIISTTLTR